MARALEEVAALPEPIGEVISSSIRPNGLEVQKVRVPLGVIFFIYESRPNVTSDAAAHLRQERQRRDPPRRQGGRPLQSRPSSRSWPRRPPRPACPPTPSSWWPRPIAPPSASCCDMPEYINLVIPRGGEGLIRRVSEEARMPVIKHFAGNCHVYLGPLGRCRHGRATGGQRQVPADGRVQRGRVAGGPRRGGRGAAAARRQGAGGPRRRNPRRPAHAADGCPQAKAGQRGGLLRRVPGPGDLRQGGRFAGRGDRAHQPLRLAAHRRDRDPRPGGGPAVRRPRSTARP